MKLAKFAVMTSLVALSLGLSGCKTGPVEPAKVESKEWTAFAAKSLDEYFKLNPSFAVYQGRHEFDGQLADWSPEGLQRRAESLKNLIDDAEAFDATLLTKEQEFERRYLVQVAKGDLFWLEDADAPHRNVTWYFDNGLDPNTYVARPYADAATRAKAFIKYARAVSQGAGADQGEPENADAAQLH